MNYQTKVTKNKNKRGILKQLFLPLIVSILVLLTGCVRYDVGVNFYEQHQGEIVQHIRLAQQLTSLSKTEANQWLNSLESRAKALQGKAKKVSDEEIIVRIPFSNGQELTDKFNHFFNPNYSKLASGLKVENPELVQLKAEMSIKQSNWIFFERNKLNIDVDLRALGVLSNQGNIIVSPGSLVDLEFVLNAPLRVRNLDKTSNLNSESNPNYTQTSWQLEPGQINHIETSFWVPSYLGIGTVIIILVILLGFYAKHRHFPGVQKTV
ncbi:unknown [Crocosphaera subtropica ATCC 51142]|uniref:DUF3153 domain-containing protein n=1 Tax=Crocosphaera subtropica (strain ATCC 51142 / BH68) TaxID=43989 RepID=B1WZ98_CROS5|nr:DUF3153 domain-containing protein [Crocosphaera subtropica]ACB49464.1 unknown [Crocosphaera subtropica ATCC 51142]